MINSLVLEVGWSGREKEDTKEAEERERFSGFHSSCIVSPKPGVRGHLLLLHTSEGRDTEMQTCLFHPDCSRTMTALCFCYLHWNLRLGRF